MYEDNPAWYGSATNEIARDFCDILLLLFSLTSRSWNCVLTSVASFSQVSLRVQYMIIELKLINGSDDNSAIRSPSFPFPLLSPRETDSVRFVGNSF